MKEIDERILRRLTFSRDLYNNAVTFCSDLNSASSFAIGLTLLHDAVDNCLASIASHLGATFKKNMYIFDYLSEIRTRDKEKIDIPFDADLDELNTLRVNIKHKGILPDILQHKELPHKIGDFLAYMAKNFLNAEFSNISLIQAIENHKVRNRIITAKEYLKQKKYEECLIELGFAMHEVVGFPLYFSFMGWRDKVKNNEDIVFPDYYAQLNVDLLEHRIEPYLFHRFRNFTPKIGIRGDIANLDYQWDDTYGHYKNWTELNCKFCLEFCIEAALKYQRKQDPRYKLISRMDAFKQVVTPIGENFIIWNKKMKDELRGVLDSVGRQQLYIVNKGDAAYGARIGKLDEEEIFFMPYMILRESGEVERIRSEDDLCVINKSDVIIEDIDIEDYTQMRVDLVKNGSLGVE